MSPPHIIRGEKLKVRHVIFYLGLSSARAVSERPVSSAHLRRASIISYSIPSSSDYCTVAQGMELHSLYRVRLEIRLSARAWLMPWFTSCPAGVFLLHSRESAVLTSTLRHKSLSFSRNYTFIHFPVPLLFFDVATRSPRSTCPPDTFDNDDCRYCGNVVCDRNFQVFFHIREPSRERGRAAGGGEARGREGNGEGGLLTCS